MKQNVQIKCWVTSLLILSRTQMICQRAVLMDDQDTGHFCYVLFPLIKHASNCYTVAKNYFVNDDLSILCSPTLHAELFLTNICCKMITFLQMRWDQNSKRCVTLCSCYLWIQPCSLDCILVSVCVILVVQDLLKYYVLIQCIVT